MKERYTLLVLSLLLVVMLYGITSVLGANNWSAPTLPFPDAENIVAPIDVGRSKQNREGKIIFETASPVATISLDIATENLKIGNASSSDFFTPYTSDGPKFRSDTPITISADGYGLVLPNIANPDGDPDIKVSGNLIFDSVAKKLKLFVNGAWKAIEGAESLWTKDAGGDISYTNGPVTVNSADLVVTGDIKINEPKTKIFYYFPAYSAIPTYISDNQFPMPNGAWPNELMKLNVSLKSEGNSINPDLFNRLPCDVSELTFDCLSTNGMSAFFASESDPDEAVDIAFFDSSKSSTLVTGFYTMKYTKYLHEYDYVYDKGVQFDNRLICGSGSCLPRYFCDTTFSGNNFSNKYECNLGSNNRFPAPPPISGWPNEIYDWWKGTYFIADKFIRIPLTREQMGFEKVISFPTNNVFHSGIFVAESGDNNTKSGTQTLGKYSFCALTRVGLQGYTRGSCDVYYDVDDSNWKLKYEASHNSGMSCKASCF